MVGASPEVLVRRVGDRIYVNPLAGSIGRSNDPEKDRSLQEGLARSDKELREHGYVVADIASILRCYCDALDVQAGSSAIGHDHLWHFFTYITGAVPAHIGMAACRERSCYYISLSLVHVSLTTTTLNK